MPIVGGFHAPDTEYAKEMRKWEAGYTPFGLPERPYVKREYPMMLHLAGAFPQGGVGIIETITIGHMVTDPKTGAVISCDPDEAAYQHAHTRGFRETPLEALDAFEKQQLEFAKLHAEREWDKRHRLSPKAAAEAERHDEAASTHLPMIPETPIKRRGRKVAVR